MWWFAYIQQSADQSTGSLWISALPSFDSLSHYIQLCIVDHIYPTEANFSKSKLLKFEYTMLCLQFLVFSSQQLAIIP